jgi:hypothetical protein
VEVRRKCLVGGSGKYRNKKVKDGKQDYREVVVEMERGHYGARGRLRANRA